jgi:beta-hydroxylase
MTIFPYNQIMDKHIVNKENETSIFIDIDIDNDTDTIFKTSNDYNKFKLLENNWQIIKNEIPELDKDKVVISRSQDTWNNQKGLEFIENLKDNKDWVKSWDGNDSWFTFPLIYKDSPVGKAEKLCPKTVKLLKQLGGIQIAAYSLLTPNSILPIHHDDTGPTFGSMSMNLLLDGTYCSLYIKQDDKFVEYKHKIGECVIFNSEVDHYADNRDFNNRVILFIDFITDK